MGISIFELGFVLVGLVFSLAPLALAIWAIVTAQGVRREVEALERRIANLEAHVRA